MKSKTIYLNIVLFICVICITGILNCYYKILFFTNEEVVYLGIKELNLSFFFRIYITNLLVCFITCSYFYKLYKPLYYSSLILNGITFGLVCTSLEMNLLLYIYPIAIIEISSILLAQGLIAGLSKKSKMIITYLIIVLLFLGAIYEYTFYPKLIKNALFI